VLIPIVLIGINTSPIIDSTMDNCCTPLFAGVINDKDANEMAPVLAALADPVRLRVVSMLAAAPDGSACGCDLEDPLGLSQPTVSHHLKVLREAGLIEGERRGRWIHYRVVPERLAEIREALSPAGVLV
jgi:ArsR family transcriptional regulator